MWKTAFSTKSLKYSNILWIRRHIQHQTSRSQNSGHAQKRPVIVVSNISDRIAKFKDFQSQLIKNHDPTIVTKASRKARSKDDSSKITASLDISIRQKEIKKRQKVKSDSKSHSDNSNLEIEKNIIYRLHTNYLRCESQLTQQSLRQ